MAQFVFWSKVFFTIAMLAAPAFGSTRGKAVKSWLIYFGGTVSCAVILSEYFPHFSQPGWTENIEWVVFVWIAFLLGIIIAITKPSKRHAPDQKVA